MIDFNLKHLYNQYELLIYTILILSEDVMENNLYNLTMPQKSILLTEQYYSNTNINNICGTAIINTEIDFKILEQALNLLVKNNDSLRLKLVKKGNSYKQILSEYKYLNFFRKNYLQN